MSTQNAKKRTKTLSKKAASEKTKKGWLFWAVRIGIFFIAFILTTAALVIERSHDVESSEFVVGQPAPRTLFSPVELSYINEKATLALRDQREKSVSPVYSIDPSAKLELQAKVGLLFDSLQSFRSAKEKGDDAELGVLPFDLDDDSLKYLSEKAPLKETKESIFSVSSRIFSLGIIDYQEKLGLYSSGARDITVTEGLGNERKETNVMVRDILTQRDIQDVVLQFIPQDIRKKRSLRDAVLNVLEIAILPNMKKNEEEVAFRQARARESVVVIEEKVYKDELLVQRGMLITPDIKERINRVQERQAKREILNQLSATSALVFLTFLLCVIYLTVFQKKNFKSIRTIVLINAVFFLTVIVSKTIAIWPGSSFYLIPTALAPLLLVLLINAHFGFVATMVMVLLSAPMTAFHPEMILNVLVTGLAGTFSALQVRKRVHFLKVGAAVGLSSFFVLFSYRIFQDYPVVESLQISALGLANGFLITAPLCFLLLPLFEALFNLTTDITLLELSDLNHPLLKRMIVEAPGTYHHSLVVSTLAESACEEIGANALLARVGCYFHDIGKIPRAEFFTENQAAKNMQVSKHTKMTPTMSSLVIMNHVKDGIELGKQYKLKDRILRFIPEHQGTGVIYYFYRKAMDQAKPGEQVNPNDFRYPGPKPQSKETAVALLADSVEAASRSLKEPTKESIRQLVRKIINDKFIDGQLDECDLTLRDLHKIQEVFVYNLMAILHTRVSYPSKPKDENNPDLFKGDEFSKFRIDDGANDKK